MTPSRNTIGCNVVLGSWYCFGYVIKKKGPVVLKAHGIVLAHGIEKGARGIEGSWY